MVILDEAQAIKNPRSLAAHAVRQLSARHRICLSGTPVENNLEELWSLFDFLMPGFLGDAQRFRSYFRLPIERSGNQQRLVVGRELHENPQLIVAENPTRGLDVRSSAYVHHRLRDAAHGGAGVVVYSSDLDEVMTLATRVCVVHRGRVVGRAPALQMHNHGSIVIAFRYRVRAGK